MSLQIEFGLHRQLRQAHPRQVQLLNLIEREPGHTFRSLGRASGVLHGNLRHHLNRLLRAGLIHERKDGVRCLHFPGPEPGDPTVGLRLEADALRGNLRRVLDVVRTGDVQKGILGRLPDMPHSTVQATLKRLEQRGFIQSHRAGRCLIYTRRV